MDPWTDMNTKHLLTEIFIKVTEAFQGLISFQEDEVRDFEHFPECNVIFFIISWALNQVTPEMETWLERKHRNKWGVQTEPKNKDRLSLRVGFDLFLPQGAELS